MTRTFREAFQDALKATGWSINKVAAEAGVSAEQLKKLNQGRSQSTNVDDALKVAHVFGVTLDEFLGDDTAQLRAEVADLWRQLSQEERDILLAAARGRGAQDRGAKP
ncbi:helix-turn-helix domain-containing protein [Fuscibacter oryzae]|uniref:Helix-turn-helix transcriptional regulator n=1 Tax=Fuscibacter oryzae TaxID=2803939 RepID=A0A8J7SU87_9RHOB|nr:helix-turn-helix domain-containing protein [Fuscibacter oryzae]MBL4929360.1 helix-turn-helix transcriptional regulator [Fuscibacter oryzae]